MSQQAKTFQCNVCATVYSSNIANWQHTCPKCGAASQFAFTIFDEDAQSSGSSEGSGGLFGFILLGGLIWLAYQAFQWFSSADLSVSTTVWYWIAGLSAAGVVMWFIPFKVYLYTAFAVVALGLLGLVFA